MPFHAAIQAISFDQSAEVVELAFLVAGLSNGRSLAVSLLSGCRVTRFRLAGITQLVERCRQECWNAISISARVEHGLLSATVLCSPTNPKWCSLDTSVTGLTTRRRLRFNATTLQRYVEHHKLEIYPSSIDLLISSESKIAAEQATEASLHWFSPKCDVIGVCDIVSQAEATWLDRLIDNLDRPPGSISSHQGIFDDVHAYMFASGRTGRHLREVTSTCSHAHFLESAASSVTAVRCFDFARTPFRIACMNAKLLLAGNKGVETE